MSSEKKVKKPGIGFFTRHDTRGRVKIKTPAGEKSRTHQSMKDECDINRIVASAGRMGANGMAMIGHQNNQQPQYLECSSEDYYESLNIVLGAQEMFNGLPSGVRARFKNEPLLFLEYVQRAENAEEAASLGLLSPEAVQRLQARKEASDRKLAAKGSARAKDETPRPKKKSSEASASDD